MDEDTNISQGTESASSDIPSIESIFGMQGEGGNQEGGLGNSGEGVIPNAGQTEDFQTLSPEDQELANAQQQQDYQRLAQIFQSRHDRLQHELTKGKYSNYSDLQSKSELLDNIMTDPTMLRALVAEVQPDLIQISEADIETKIESTLAKEFGDEFEFDPNEAARKPWSVHGRYQKRANELYEKHSKIEQPGSIKEIMAARQQKAEEDKATYQKTMNDIRSEFKWDDRTLKTFVQWGQNMKPRDYAIIFNKLLNSTQGQTRQRFDPNVSQHSGAGKNNNPMSKLIDMFGMPQ